MAATLRNIAILSLVLMATPCLADGTGNAAHGKVLVEANCAQCHGIGATDKSPHAQAPELRTLSERYPLDALEEAFVEGIYSGHPDMPEFVATPAQIADIIAYIATIEP